MLIKIEKLNENAIIPFKPGDNTDGAYDLFAVNCMVKFNKRKEPRLWYGLGFKTEIPEGYRVKIAPRSSICKESLRLCNPEGIIDSKYRGEWFAIFEPSFELRKRDIVEINNGVLTDIEGIYDIGDAVAQCYLEKIDDIEWIETTVNMEEDRGGGFGHTSYNPINKPNINLENNAIWQKLKQRSNQPSPVTSKNSN